MRLEPSMDDFINAFGLIRKGSEFVGPCPICKDGKDRFHVKQGANGPVFGCRQCMTNGDVGKNENAKQVYALLRAQQNPSNGHRSPATSQTVHKSSREVPSEPSALPSGPDDTSYFYTSADGEMAFAVVRQDLKWRREEDLAVDARR